jgi:hypothetical protein
MHLELLRGPGLQGPVRRRDLEPFGWPSGSVLLPRWREVVGLYLCVNCLHVDERQIEYCPSCGSGEQAKVARDGSITAFPAAAGLGCQHCLERDVDLRFRSYRRVSTFIFWAQIHRMAGYYCRRCRRNNFLRWQGATLLLGWWGLLSLFLYNPFAILANFWALFAAPVSPGRLGAIPVDDIREYADREARLHQLYAQMPAWIKDLDEDELALALSDANYYLALGVSPEATEAEIKQAYRSAAKAFHPDLVPPGDVEEATRAMAEVNEAYQVLGNPRLRYAYDHAAEIIAAIQGERDPEDELADLPISRQDGPYGYRCDLCGLQFDDLERALGHLQAAHTQGAQSTPVDGSPPHAEPWRCKQCGARFADYAEASEHLDRAHPQVMAVNPVDQLELI